MPNEEAMTDADKIEELAKWLETYQRVRGSMPVLPTDDDRNYAAIQTFCLPSQISEWATFLRSLSTTLIDLGEKLNEKDKELTRLRLRVKHLEEQVDAAWGRSKRREK
jgi:hypothetical protein